MKGLFYWIARAWREGPGNRRRSDRSAWVPYTQKEQEDDAALQQSHELVENSLNQMNDLVATALRANADAEIYRARLRAVHRAK